MSDFNEGQTATNPKTGQKVVFKGGQWRSLSAPTMLGGREGAADRKARLALTGKARAAGAVERQLGAIEQMYNKNFRGIGPGSVLEYLPTQSRKQFDAAANGMRPLLKPMIRDPGEGAFTEGDQALLDSMIPNGSEADAGNEQRIANIRALVEDARKNAGDRRGMFKVIR